MPKSLNLMSEETYLKTLRRDLKVPVDSQEELELVAIFGGRLLAAAVKYNVEKAIRNKEYDGSPINSFRGILLKDHYVVCGEDIVLNYDLCGGGKRFSEINGFIEFGNRNIHGLFLKLCTDEEIIFSPGVVTNILETSYCFNYESMDLLQIEGYVRPLVYYFDGKLRVLALGLDGELVRYV